MFPEFNTTGYFIDLLALCFVLLPLAIFIKNDIVQRIILSVSGAYMLYLIAPRLLLFYLGFWSVVFILQRIIALTTDIKYLGTGTFWLCIVGIIAPMVAWKLNYEDFSTIFNVILNQGIEYLTPEIIHKIDLARAIIIPIGLSFATFRGIDLLVKTWLGKFNGLSPLQVFFYGFFPPVQIVGPIIEYEEIAKRHDITAQDVYGGLMRIAFGLIKVLIIAAVLQKSAVIFQQYETSNVIKIWTYLFIYTWFFYLNFSGYSDLAIGVSRLLGYKLKENFNFPYFRKNVSEFWNNWHMSLSRFAQRNAYVPLGGYRKQTQYIAILGTIFTIALWHNISWGMVVFALYHGIGLILHRAYGEKIKWPEGKLGDGAKIATTYLFVLLSFPLLILPLEEAILFYISMISP